MNVYLDFSLTNWLKEVIYKGRKFWDIAKLVRHQILTLESVGSSPTIPAIYQ